MSNKQKSVLCFVSSLIVSIGIPVTVTVTKYDMYNVIKETKTSIKISIIGAIICLILFFSCFKRIMHYLNSLTFSITVSVLKGITKLIPLGCIFLIITNLHKVIQDMSYITSWVMGCSTISFLILDPLTDLYSYEAKRDEQKAIVKEGMIR